MVFFFGQNQLVIKCIYPIIRTKTESGSATFEVGSCFPIVPAELSS